MYISNIFLRYRLILNNGVANVRPRENLNFVGATISDDPTNNATKLIFSGGGGGGVTTLFVFQPGGSQVNNVYTDWSDLVAAAAATPGPKFVYFDNSFGACTVPSGSWSLGPEVYYVGNPSQQLAGQGVTFADGASLQDLPASFADLYMYCLGSDPVYEGDPGGSPCVVFRNTVVDCTAGDALLSITGSTPLQVDMFEQSATSPNGVVFRAAGDVIIVSGDSSGVLANSVAGNTITIYNVSSSSQSVATQSPTADVINFATAVQTYYDDSALPHLSVDTVQAAIDALKSGGGGGGVTDVTASAPLASSGGTTPDISLTGTISVAHGGTNSTTALNNNRIIKSSGGAIVEAAAITASRALKSDANGIPVASTATAAAIDALSGTNTGDQTITLTGNVTGSGTGSFATTVAVVPFTVVNTSLAAANADISVNTHKITNVVDPTNPQDAATKNYVDSAGGVPSTRTITAGTGLTGGGDLSANRTISIADTAVTPASYGDAADVATFTVNQQGQLTAAGTAAIAIAASAVTSGTLPVARGGTNSGTTLNNNRVIQSSGGAIVEAAAITAARALVSDANGIPTHATTTATEIGYVSGVTSAIQTQLNAKQATLTIGNLTDAGTDGITVTGGTGAVIGSGTSLSQHVADSTHNGYLSSTDWSTFNAKQATVTVGNLDSQSANAQGLALASNVLSTQSADATHPGVVNNTTQTLSGNKTFTGATAITSTSTTALTVNSTDLIVDATNHAVGIGTLPDTTAVLDIVNNSGGTKAITATGYGSNVGFRGRRANGTLASPTATTAADILSFFSGRGYGTSAFASTGSGAVNIVAGETFTNSSMATYITLQTTPTASTTAVERMRVNSTGNILIGTSTDSGLAILQVNGAETVAGAFTQSGGAFSLTGTGASTSTTASGAHTVDSAAALSLGTSTATSIGVGKSGITTTITGGLTQLTGAVSLTGNAASQLSTSSGALTLDSAAALNLGNTNATSVAVGKSGITTTVTGGLTQQTGVFSLTGNAASSIGTSSGNLDIDCAAILTFAHTSATALTVGRTGVTTVFSGRINVSEAFITGQTALKTANYSVASADYFIRFGTLSGAVTLTLLASPFTGVELMIIDANGTCSATNTITISGNGNTINGQTTLVIATAYGYARIKYCGGGVWLKIG